MKKWFGSAIILSLFVLLVLRYGFLGSPFPGRTIQNHPSYNLSNHLHWKEDDLLPAVQSSENDSQVVSAYSLVSSLFSHRNFSKEELQSLLTWNHMNSFVSRADGLPNAIEAVREARSAWESLMDAVQEEKRHGSLVPKEKQCPYSIRRMNSSELSGPEFRLRIPCGLDQGSSITVIGTPGLLGDFRIDLIGTRFPGEQDPPIILHYNVRLHGDKITEDPVIVQNTWTIAQDWGAEERCPSPDPNSNRKVDELDQCSNVVGKDDKRIIMPRLQLNVSRKSSILKEGSTQSTYFPFRQGYLTVATLRVGVEGIQMTVDGKHITSFAYRESLEPWLVNEVRISGDIKLVSVLVSGLPASEDIDHVIDLETLKAPSLSFHKPLDIFIGIFSTANNFKRRMAVRRTWLQYSAVKSGAVAVRFFVGLHKNQMVNEELWNEARTYGDIQLMPFIDYYSLITWKTIAICIYGTHVVSAKYVMKTDDDAFVRIDEVLASLKNANLTRGLLYGLINFGSQPHRTIDSKWYISPEEWPYDKYPPWAHGPGYVVSRDVAKSVYRMLKMGKLRMFKLEDVAMGIWIADMKESGKEIKYVKEERIYNEGCQSGYVVAHYQGPRDMLCLWQKLQETHQATCCGDP